MLGSAPQPLMLLAAANWSQLVIDGFTLASCASAQGKTGDEIAIAEERVNPRMVGAGSVPGQKDQPGAYDGNPLLAACRCTAGGCS